MKHLLFSLGLFAALVAAAPAQSTATPKAAQSDATFQKIRQLDVLIQLLPLNLKKAQIDLLLTALEKARDSEKKIRSLEDDDLAKLAPKISEALKNAQEKGAYPPRELQTEIAALTRAMGIRRQVATGEMVDDLYKVVDTGLEAGQKTVMAKSLAAAALDPSLKGVKMTDEQKVKFYIRQILLDITAYESLKDLRKTAS
jgi:hypothetical protein